MFRLAVALGVLTISALGVHPDAHQLLHADAADTGHSCPLTVWADGQLEPVTPAPGIEPVPVSFKTSQVFSEDSVGETDCLWPPAVGPPVR